MLGALTKIAAYLSQRTRQPGTAILLGSHERIPLRKDAFVPLSPAISTAKIMFIDGGNGELYRAPHASVQLVRLCALTYCENQRVAREVHEYVVVVHAIQKGLDLDYEVRVLELSGAERLAFTVDANDPSLRTGNHRVEPATVAGHCRKLLELAFAVECVQQKPDILIQDGDLEPTATREYDAVEALTQAALREQVVLLGFSKSTTLCTDTGNSAPAVLSSMASGSWIYLAGRVGFVRLHPKSSHVFRVDYLPQQRDRLLSALNLLAFNATDPTFLGYPYGLIDVDRFARVSNDEATYARVRFQTLTNLAPAEAALNAHELF